MVAKRKGRPKGTEAGQIDWQREYEKEVVKRTELEIKYNRLNLAEENLFLREWIKSLEKELRKNGN